MSASRRFTVFAVAAVLVSGALALTAALVERADIESELTARAQEALAQSRLPTDVVTFSGRDATVRADSRREALLAKAVIDEVDGVRSVEIAAPKSASEPHTERKAGLQRGIDEALADTPITFAADSANLDAAGRQAVKNVADLLTEAPTDWRFEIAGHVARVPGAGTGKRPEAVVRACRGRGGGTGEVRLVTRSSRTCRVRRHSPVVRQRHVLDRPEGGDHRAIAPGHGGTWQEAHHAVVVR